jgi:hypothetical protein
MNPTLDEVQELTLSNEPETVSAGDVDFNTRQDETLARLTAEKMGTAPPEKPKDAEPEPKAEGKAAPEVAEKPEKSLPEPEKEAPKPLTQDDIQRLINEGVAKEIEKRKPVTAAEKKARAKLAEDRFADVDEWSGVFGDEVVEEAVAKSVAAIEEKLSMNQAEEAELATKRTAWEEAEKEAAIKIPNYAAIKAEAATMPFHEGALKFILDQGKLGPHFVKYFVENKGEWDDIVKMSPEDMRVELRVIGRELKRGASAVTAAPTPVKKVSSAREPLQTVSGQQAPTQEGEGEDFNARQNRVLAEMRRNRLGQFQTN